MLITLPATLRDRNRTRALARRPLSDYSQPCRIVGQARAAHRLSRPSCGWRLGLAGRHTGRASNQPLYSKANGHASGAIRGPGYHAPRLVRPNGYAGPDEATEAVSQYEPTNELMDWAFAEGGYLIDYDEKRALVFGCPVDLDEFAELGEGADSSFQQGGLPFLQQIGPNWIGWELVWDDHGVDAFAAHLRRRSIGDIAVQPDSHPPDTTGPIEFRP